MSTHRLPDVDDHVELEGDEVDEGLRVAQDLLIQLHGDLLVEHIAYACLRRRYLILDD